MYFEMPSALTCQVDYQHATATTPDRVTTVHKIYIPRLQVQNIEGLFLED